MDIFEKQQTIEAIKMAVKARWFYTLVVTLQALVVKIVFGKTVPLATSPLILFVILLILVSNFGFWAYFRRPTEKINGSALKIVKGFLIIFDQLAISVIFYFSGTANKMFYVTYFATIMVGSVLYKTRGVILVTLSTVFLYNSLILLEYFGLMPPLSIEAVSQSPYRYLKGDLDLVKGQMIGFNLYLPMFTVIAGYLASLFKKREGKLIEQKNNLTLQTQELIQAKDQLNEALVKSDKAKEETEKTNIELKEKIDELERFSKVTVGRELKMAELKQKIKELEEKEPDEKTGGQ